MPATGHLMKYGVTAALSTALMAAAAWAGPAASASTTAIRDRATLASVSCPGGFRGVVPPGQHSGTNWCMAVGTYIVKFKSHALAQVWNGSKWRLVPRVPGTELSSVSCLTGSFCVAAGGPTGAEQWNGHAWRTVNMGKPDGGLNGITCGSPKSCMLIFPRLNGPEVQSWNGGTKWQVQTKTTNVCFGPAGAPCGLASVSCGNATNCVAVGTTQYQFSSDQKPSSVVWNGKRWAFSQPPGVGDPAAMNAVSCAGRFCMAVGGGSADFLQGTIAIAATWNAATRTWADVSPDLGHICNQKAACAWASVIACGSPKLCVTLGPAGPQAWDGQGWQPAPTVHTGAGSSLGALSCGQNFCVAVGYQRIGKIRHSLTEIWKAGSWTLQKPVDPF